MRVSETPEKCEELDLLKQLVLYGEGKSSWRQAAPLGDNERAECKRLHTALVSITDQLFRPMLNRVNSREMKTFTMHDSRHGLKVAHLMWNIMDEPRRLRLTPPEIAMLVISAHLHDLGMGISEEERTERLSDESDLWLKIDVAAAYKRTLDDLSTRILAGVASDKGRSQAISQVAEAQDALLCTDLRERHATALRYQELIESFRELHRVDVHKVPSIDEALHFYGDSFEGRLIDICVSHNEDASSLLGSRLDNRRELRFPLSYTVGTCQADLKFVAAALRIADILDFDRERVPAVLYHYLLPRSPDPARNISVREWQKHMTISNWEFSKERLIFRGHSTNPVAHHAVVEFCKTIEVELKRTRAVFSDGEWFFGLGDRVDTEIHAEGFTYLPYRFHLQEEKIFSLLMGRGIYDNPLDGIRELLQNSVDSCQLRDSLLRAYQPSVEPKTDNRITISYHESDPNGEGAKLIIQDSGTGMDRWIIENYFLKVGESYYQSSDFLRTNAILWSKQVVFAPVSEFGIGFISCFMLSEHIEVETAMKHSPRQDSTRRILDIDGLGQLIRVTEFSNDGYEAFEGTKIVLHLKDGNEANATTRWNDIIGYIQRVCVDLPYSLILRCCDFEGRPLTQEEVVPKGLLCNLPPEIEAAAIKFKVGSHDKQLEGEVAIFRFSEISEIQKNDVDKNKFSIAENRISGYSGESRSELIRGGFSLGPVPGLPSYVGFISASTGVVRINALKEPCAHLPRTNLARTRLVENEVSIGDMIIRSWLEPLIAEPDNVEKFGLGVLMLDTRRQTRRHRGRTERNISGHSRLGDAMWLEQYSAFNVYRAARAIWRLDLSRNGNEEDRISSWENGNGDSLYLGVFSEYLHRSLLELVLPFVCKLQVGESDSRYAAPPIKEWEEVLSANRSFISKPLQWEDFADYRSPINHLLYFDCTNTSFMASQYKDQLSIFSSEQLSFLRSCFHKVIEGKSHSYRTTLTNNEISLLRQVADLLPDAMIGGTSLRGVKLRSFQPDLS